MPSSAAANGRVMGLSLEDKRKQASQAYKQLELDEELQRGRVKAARRALQAAQQELAGRREAYAALSFLAVTFTDGEKEAEVHVRAAEILSQHYPMTRWGLGEGSLLIEGFKRGVHHQAQLAEECKHEMSQAAEHLQVAQLVVPRMEAQIVQEQERLEAITRQKEAARAEYRILLFPKQWTRYRWAQPQAFTTHNRTQEEEEMSDPEAVGSAFIAYYYQLFETNRQSLAPLYQDASMLTFEGQKYQGTQAIITKIAALPFGVCKVHVASKDFQPSVSGGIMVFVTGNIQIEGEQHPLKFSQVFHLMPLGSSFIVTNDMFRLNYA